MNGIDLSDGTINNRKLDYSAINYCVESYVITSFINTLSGLETPANCECGYNHSNNPLKISGANDPENSESDFCIHKRGIIKNVVESNLNQAITSYSRNNANGEYKLPKLTETDWDQVLTNVSIITFIQNIPIGMKYYNNYAIATSTSNKEYVDPDEIYLNASDGDSEYYHTPYCEKLGKNDLIGYRSIDYVQKSYIDIENDETKYYYRHSYKGDAIDANQACYYCLVQRSLYNEDKTNDKEKAYNTALARERYVARMSKLPAETESVIEILGVSDTVGTGMIYIKKDDEIVSGISAISKKITKSDVGKTFKIYGESNNISATSGEEINASSTSLNNPAEVITEALSNRACYTTDDSIDVTIAEYNDRGVSIVYRRDGGEPDYGAGGSKDIFGKETFIPSDVGTGFVNVKLHYKTNYTVGTDKRVEVWANINDHDNLTIAVKPIGITGRLRLEFTDGTNTYYYSKNTFNVNEGDEIFCNIPSDTVWYGKDWRVNVLNVDNAIIATGKVEYYTINDATGLKGFSNAVNGTKGPEGGATTAGRTFKVINDINNVGELAPIAGVNKLQRDGWNSIWFEGDFQGQDHTINGITMSYTNDETYNSFGLFGWVGKNARISGLKVGINVASFNSSKPKDKDRDKDNRICIGGIAGYTDGQINNCTIMSSSNIGAGSISVNSEIIKKDIYYVGGIAGYTKGAITQCKVESNVKVKGGKIDHSNSTKLDKFLETYAGGLIGYKETNQEINDSFSANCTVEGYDNVGGIIGFNAGGDINNVSFKGSLTGSGENIGGIVGCNTGGNITNCTNTIDISVENAKNVGGIVGCNNKKNITNCNNNALIKGKENVGGIAGITYSTTIKSCNNFGNIEAKEGFGPDYWIMWKIYTGTGGIAGKLYTSTVEQSANSGNIKSTVNVGGIAGLNWCSKVYYSYNKGNVEATSVSGQVGGICGHGSGVDILACYNIGNIKGKKDLAGIMGSCVNDTKYPDVKLEEYEDKYLYLDFTPGEIHNYFKYCYNAGNVTDTSDSVLGIKVDSSAGILGKRMLGLNDISMSITFVECYFLDNVKQKGYKAPDIDEEDSNVHKMSEEELKRQLYIWASNDAGNGGLFINDNYIYNTITPLETGKGYQGYGILWWELKNYNRTEFYIGSYYSKEEPEGKTYKYRTIEDEKSVTLKIEEKEVTIDDKNKKHFDDGGVNVDLHSWIMLIKDGSYNLEASAKDYGKAAQENYSINSTSKNKILALLHTGVENAVLTTSGATTYNWDYTFEEKVPCKYIYDSKIIRADEEAINNDNIWKKENEKLKTFSYNSKFGNSKEENTKDIAQVYLDGLDGEIIKIFRNKRHGDITYKWDGIRVGNYYSTRGINKVYWWWKKGNEEHPCTISKTTEKDSKCTISIPMKSLKNATSDLDLSYNPETCTVSKAELNVKIKYWINDNIISKLDFTDAIAKITEKLKTMQVKDNLKYQASFGNVNSGEIKKEIEYSLYTTEEFAKNDDMEIKLDLINSNVLDSDSNENVNLTLEWDAEWMGIHIAITEVNFEVEYTIANKNDGIFRFYDL